MNDNKERTGEDKVEHVNLKPVENPFTNGKSIEEDLKANGLELDAEQQFKEAQTERD